MTATQNLHISNIFRTNVRIKQLVLAIIIIYEMLIKMKTINYNEVLNG